MKTLNEVKAIAGLSAAEAARRLREEGPNELPSPLRRGTAEIALELLREPMILLLLACGVTYLLIGDAREAWLILASISFVVGIEWYQEAKTERALQALRDLSSPRALVIRDGQHRRIPGREVVRGDLVVLAEGDRVPADGIVRWRTHLLVDESLLTGESQPVRKADAQGPRALERPGGEELCSVFAGTLVVQGQGQVEVLATGSRTEMGKIGRALAEIEPEQTTIQRETSRVVRVMAVIGLGLCLLVAVLYALTRGSWLEGLLAGLTLAISMVPEELPVVLTVFLALGAWRISRHKVLTRRIPAVEMLGSATVLCADKTGTLTLNRMAARRLCAEGRSYLVPDEPQPLPAEFEELARAGLLASRPDPIDPTDLAMEALAGRIPGASPAADWVLTREYPLSRRRLAVSQVWRSPDGRRLVAAKGAPEAIAELCRLAPERAGELSRQVGEMAGSGLRVLGVAKAAAPEGELPGDAREFAFEFLGLVGLADPIRPAVPAAIAQCKAAGIRVVMITGDYPETARHIARQIGLEPAGEVLTGQALEAMDEETLRLRVRSVNLFARIVPDQKLQLVNALKADGEIVAMTGDGVNDAPALKAAHIGIAMGARGTDVAREAAALVLLDDDFSSIVQAVALGRRVFDNLQKAIAYVFAVHLPIAGMSLIPVILGGPLVLLPVHIVFLELIIDPACSVVFEAEAGEANVMRRPPRSPRERLLSPRLLAFSLLQGASALGLVLATYLVAVNAGRGEAEVRALTFTMMILANLALIMANRSWTRAIVATLWVPNPALWAISAGALTLLGLVLTVPFLRELFRFGVLQPREVAYCGLAALGSVLWLEALKMAVVRRKPRQG